MWPFLWRLTLFSLISTSGSRVVATASAKTVADWPKWRRVFHQVHREKGGPRRGRCTKRRSRRGNSPCGHLFKCRRGETRPFGPIVKHWQPTKFLRNEKLLSSLRHENGETKLRRSQNASEMFRCLDNKTSHFLYANNRQISWIMFSCWQQMNATIFFVNAKPHFCMNLKYLKGW